MTKLKYIFIYLVISNFCNAQSVFQKMISLPDSSLVIGNRSIRMMPDSTFILLLSSSFSPVGDTSKAFVLKIDIDGSLIWQTEFSTDSTFGFAGISYVNDGYLISGTSISSAAQDILLLKLDFNGDTVWMRKYPDAGGGFNLKRRANGDIILIGSSTISQSPSQRNIIMRTDSLGNVVTFNKYNSSNYGSSRSIFTADGGALLFDASMNLIKTNPAGNIMWTSPKITSGLSVYHVAETHDSAYMVLAGDYINQHIILAKVNSIGDTLWTRSLSNSQNCIGLSLKLLYDGGFVICGSTGTFTNSKTLLIRTDSLANVSWSKTYNVNNNGPESGFDVEVLPDYGFMVFGQFRDTTNQNRQSILMLRTDSAGNTNCLNYDANVINVANVLWTDTNYNISKVPMTASMSNTTIQSQNSNLFFADSCIVSSIEEPIQSSTFSISLYPNPFYDELTIHLNKPVSGEIILYDLRLSELLHHSFRSSVNMNTSHLSKGIYIYEMRTNDGSILKGKVVKL